MENRIKIKLVLSPPDKMLELAGKMLLAIMWGLTVFTFSKLPATIPVHFNALGQPDGYGDKITLLILPAIGTIIYVALTQLNKYPHLFNYMTKITEANVQQQYGIATRVIRFLKFAILFIFSLIILFTYLTATGVIKGLSPWFLPLMFLFIGIPVGTLLMQSFRKK